MSASSAVRPCSRRAVLTLVWVGAFVILGLVGLRLHGAEAIGTEAPAAVAAQAVTEDPKISTAQAPLPGDGNAHTADNDLQQSWHFDLVTICVLIMLATMILVALFIRRPWLLHRPSRLRERAMSLPRAPTRQRPLLLLLSISRT